MTPDIGPRGEHPWGNGLGVRLARIPYYAGAALLVVYGDRMAAGRLGACFLALCLLALVHLVEIFEFFERPVRDRRLDP